MGRLHRLKLELASCATIRSSDASHDSARHCSRSEGSVSTLPPSSPSPDPASRERPRSAARRFPHLTYINLEAPDGRDFAERDPRGLLNQIGSGAILDEIQRVPGFLS